jgi:hypothetical protein
MKRIINTDVDALDLTRNYHQDNDMKPRGLWYAINYEWLAWCHGNMDHWIKPNNFSIDINIDKMLVISSREEMNAMIIKYEIKMRESWAIKTMDWERVTKDYAGIEIRNYYSLRGSSPFEHLWVSGWDISSGYIWDLSIIKTVKNEKIKNKNYLCIAGE